VRSLLRGTAILAGTLACLALPGLASGYEQTANPDAGAVTGTVRASAGGGGTLTIDKNRDVCGNSQPDEAVLVSGGGLKNAVVSIEGIQKGPRKPLPSAATVDQKSCVFIPRVQVVAAGGSYELLNGDPVFHNVRMAQGGRSLHNVAMPFKGMRVKRSVNGPGVVKVSCDAHSWMRAWVVVKDHPYVTVTDASGSFSIEGVPPGSYKVEVWHESLGTRSGQVTVSPRGQATVNFSY
jgi:plastocyanin